MSNITRKTDLSTNSPDQFQRACKLLTDELATLSFCGDQVIRISQPVPACNLLHWLNQFDHTAGCYWRTRNQAIAIAGVDAAIKLVGESEQQLPELFARMDMLTKDNQATFIGGYSFTETDGQSIWNGAPFCQFILPLIEIDRHHTRYTISLNLYANNAVQFEQLKVRISDRIQSMVFPSDPIPAETTPVPLSLEQRPNRSSWEQLINKTLTLIKNNQLEKLVLARENHFRFGKPIDSYQLLSTWQALNPNSFAFMLPLATGSFIGCTPERLYSRQQGELNTESLAGTITRGDNSESDFVLEQQLMSDPKLCREHEVVTNYLLRQLKKITSDVQPDKEASIFKLDHIQHRYLKIRARLNPDCNDDNILSALHPTPAVCGMPTDKALKCISEMEPFDRGWYAGVIGVFSHQCAEYAVGIRSAFISGSQLWATTGVGIVEGSIAEQEWQELDSKLASLLTALHLPPG